MIESQRMGKMSTFYATCGELVRERVDPLIESRAGGWKGGEF